MTPDASFVLVRVTESTRNVLDSVADDVFDDGLSDELVDGFLAAGQLLVVAVADGVVAGQAQAMIQHHLHRSPELYLDNLGVSPEHRRQGMATALVEDVRRWATELGCDRGPWIVTEPDNDAANALYGALGAVRESAVLYDLGEG